MLEPGHVNGYTVKTLNVCSNSVRTELKRARRCHTELMQNQSERDHGLTIVALANGEDVDLPSVVNGIAALYLPASPQRPRAARQAQCKRVDKGCSVPIHS
jgi:hypothetical protein